jgi:hypothetical protein
MQTSQHAPHSASSTQPASLPVHAWCIWYVREDGPACVGLYTLSTAAGPHKCQNGALGAAFAVNLNPTTYQPNTPSSCYSVTCTELHTAHESHVAGTTQLLSFPGICGCVLRLAAASQHTAQQGGRVTWCAAKVDLPQALRPDRLHAGADQVTAPRLHC